MNDTNQVRRYFNRIAAAYDSIHSGERRLSGKIVDGLFRKSMRERFKLTLEECKDIRGRKILDVGCGSGRYSIELAKAGALEVVGIDFSEKMLGVAETIAEKSRVNDVCHFVLGDFLDYHFKVRFDILLAIGMFDYVEEPGEVLKKMQKLTIEKVIASFPAKWTVMTLSRKLRLKMGDCPVYFYTRKQIEGLLLAAHFREQKVIKIGRDYFVVARP